MIGGIPESQAKNLEYDPKDAEKIFADFFKE